MHLLDNRDFGYRHVSFFIVAVAHDGGAAWLGCLDLVVLLVDGVFSIRLLSSNQ